jgi:NMT1/THI5 domain protein
MVKRFLALLLLCAVIPPAAAGRRWVLTMPWIPQAQFAGIYYAKEAGVFARYGLDVRIRHRLTEVDIFDYLKDPESELVVAPLVAALRHGNASAPLANIAQFSQNSSVMLVARGAGVGRLGQLNSRRPDGSRRRVGVWRFNFDTLPKIFLARQKLDVDIVPVNSGISLFLWDAVDALAVMSYNEYYQILAAGFNPEELIRFRLRDYGLNIPEDGLYALRETVRRCPEECRLMRLAILEGWRLAMKHPNEALKYIRLYCDRENSAFDVAHQRWMLGAYSKELELGNPQLRGKLQRKSYDSTVKLLTRHGELASAPSYEDFCPALPREVKP